MRTRSSRSDRPFEAAQPIIMPQRADHGRATISYGRRERVAPLTWADDIFGTRRAPRPEPCATPRRATAGLTPVAQTIRWYLSCS